MIPEFWTTRSEAYLAAILGERVELPEPQTRLEMFLAKIAGMDVTPPEPQARAEIYLASILGANVALPAPLSRVDFYLAKIAGMDVEIPEPLTRIDEYLAEWAENGSGEIVTVTGTSPLVLANAMAHAIRKLVQYGKCTTSGGDIYCNNGKLVALDDELPVGYKRVLGFSCNNNAMWKITGFKLRGSDTVRVSFSVTAACNVWGCYQGASDDDNYDLYASTSSGAKYFRYGDGTYLSYFAPSDLGQRFDVVYTPTGSTGMPQDSTWEPMTFESANDLMLGTTATSSSSAKLKGSLYGDFIVDGRLHLVPCERVSDGVLGYYDLIGETFYGPSTGFAGAVSLGYDTSHLTVLSVVGTPEVLTIGTQTAHVESLFEVGGVADEQDIISGVITRKVEVSVSAGVITLSALATPVTEHTTPQPLSTVEGSNTVSWTAEVSGTVKEVEYAQAAAPSGDNLVGSAVVGTAKAG